MYAKYFVLFAILFTGWFLRKINFIDDKMNDSINKLIVYFAYPCLIVHNIGNLDMAGNVLTSFLIAFGLSLAMLYLYGFISYIYARFRKFPKETSNLFELAMTTPNDGFMGFPVALIFFGDMGLLLMLAHNAAIDCYLFTYGTSLLRRNYEGTRKAAPGRVLKALLKLLLNPNILALFVGFIISFIGGTIPEPVDDYLVYIGDISTPMAMIFIGSTLAGYSFKEIIRDRLVIEAGFVKLILLPVITAAAVYFMPVAPVIKCIVVLGTCFPTAATVSMLSQQEGHDPAPTSKALFFSTVLSMATVSAALKIITLLFM